MKVKEGVVEVKKDVVEVKEKFGKVKKDVVKVKEGVVEVKEDVVEVKEDVVKVKENVVKVKEEFMSFLERVEVDNIEDEMKIQLQLYECIDKKKSFMFKAGAGAGKTYSLVESLRYILKNYSHTLMRNNQRVLCITYTNVATNEIKERR